MVLIWRPMITGQVADGRIPPLLLAHDFRNNRYDVYVTDLVNMWTESMDRRAINKRALITDTSIDPTEDDEQMKLLLDKLKQGLQQDHDSELAITMRSDGHRYTEGVLPIYMKITVDLPKPFKPFEWTLELEPCNREEFTNQLTIPLIEAQEEARNQVQSLLAVVRQKDHIIEKLIDKLEASGTELGQVFPSATGKGGGKLTKKAVQERVVGLAPFETETWHAEFLRGEEEKGKSEFEYYNELICRCFVPSGTDLPSGHQGVGDNHGDWWKDIKDENITICKNSHSDGSPVAIANKAHEKGQGQQARTKSPEEDRQIQRTSPFASQKFQPSPSHHTRSRHVLDDDETDDEGLDTALQSNSTKVPEISDSPEKATSKLPAEKLDKLGGKKTILTRSLTPPPGQPPQSSQSQTVVDDDDTTEGEDDFEVAPPKENSSPKKEKESSQKRATSPTPPPDHMSPKKTTKKGGLGKIGGNKKLSSPHESENEDAQTQQGQMPSRTRPKLGHVGGKKDGVEDAGGGRGRMVEKEEERPRETSTEARQRRKREMDERLEKEAARPKKKKRIF